MLFKYRGQFMPEVFLSYRRGKPDEALAEQLYNYLQRRGVDVFRDRDDIPLGADWDHALGSALDTAKFLWRAPTSSWPAWPRMCSDFLVA